MLVMETGAKVNVPPEVVHPEPCSETLTEYVPTGTPVKLMVNTPPELELGVAVYVFVPSVIVAVFVVPIPPCTNNVTVPCVQEVIVEVVEFMVTGKAVDNCTAAEVTDPQASVTVTLYHPVPRLVAVEDVAPDTVVNVPVDVPLFDHE
jgi:hypothetical protein